jgi:hypothetical protein
MMPVMLLRTLRPFEVRWGYWSRLEAVVAVDAAMAITFFLEIVFLFIYENKTYHKKRTCISFMLYIISKIVAFFK